jgi:hypothetical protein
VADALPAVDELVFDDERGAGHDARAALFVLDDHDVLPVSGPHLLQPTLKLRPSHVAHDGQLREQLQVPVVKVRRS